MGYVWSNSKVVKPPVVGELAVRAWEEVVRGDMAAFIHKSFSTVEPSTTYLPNWHIELIGEYLEACRKRELKRLIINMPPRALKSVCVSVAWPAFLLGRNPAERIMVASYAQGLSLKHALDSRLLIQSPWYRRLFPETRIASDANEKHKFITTQRGYRLATSVGGTVTGEGGNVLIVDDLLSAWQAESDTYRTQANQWFDTVFSTRLDDKEKGVIVVVMQRLHEDDLTGHLLAKGGWEQLSLPAISDDETRYAMGRYEYLRKAAEPLHNERESIALIGEAKRALGAYAFAAQYQQQPLAHDGGMIKRDWLKRYRELPEFMERIVQSWDTAIKAGAEHDASACITFGEREGKFYVLEVLVIKAEYPELKRTLTEQAERWHPNAILIEDKASGQMLLQDARRDSTLPVIACKSIQDKLSRLAAVSSLIEAGRLFLPHQASWLASFEIELLGFPHSKHDDQVDALSQYLNWIRSKQVSGPSVRKV